MSFSRFQTHSVQGKRQAGCARSADLLSTYPSSFQQGPEAAIACIILIEPEPDSLACVWVIASVWGMPLVFIGIILGWAVQRSFSSFRSYFCRLSGIALVAMKCIPCWLRP